MKILAISGSLRQGSHNTDLLRGAAASRAGRRRRRAVPRAEGDPAVRRRRRHPGQPPGRRRSLQGGSRRRRRRPDLDPRVQLLDPGRAQERARLGVAPARRVARAEQAGRRDRRRARGMFGGVWAAEETRKVLGALGARTIEDTVAVPKADERLANGVDAALLRRAALGRRRTRRRRRGPRAARRCLEQEALDAPAVSSSASQSTRVARRDTRRPRAGRRALRRASSSSASYGRYDVSPSRSSVGIRTRSNAGGSRVISPYAATTALWQYR